MSIQAGGATAPHTHLIELPAKVSIAIAQSGVVFNTVSLSLCVSLHLNRNQPLSLATEGARYD